MNYIFIFSAYICMISVFLKCVIHLYLENSMGRGIFFRWPAFYFKLYFSKYNEPVAEKLERLKRVCNFSFRIYAITFPLCLIILTISELIGHPVA
jgi:hypothetical protein